MTGGPEETPLAKGDVTPPHAPEGGWARRLLGPFHVTGIFWYRFPHFGMRYVLGPWLFPPAVVLFTTGFFCFLVRIRRAIAANLEPVLGPCGRLERLRRAYRTLWEFAWCYGERYQHIDFPERFAVEVETDPGSQEVLDTGQGVVFVTAHVGTWEMASHLVSTGLKRHVHVVREQELNPAAQEFMKGLLEGIGDPLTSFHFASDDPRLGMILMDALRRGEAVALQGDRPRAGGKSLAATLFGRPISLPLGPATLARSARAWIIPTFAFRTGRQHYRVVVRTPFKVAHTDNRTSDVEEATRRIAREVEWAIIQKPHQWFCFRKLWA